MDIIGSANEYSKDGYPLSGASSVQGYPNTNKSGFQKLWIMQSVTRLMQKVPPAESPAIIILEGKIPNIGRQFLTIQL